MDSLNYYNSIKYILHRHFLPLKQEMNRKVCEEQVPFITPTSSLAFKEHFLQIIWNEQAIKKPLQTTDGKNIEVISAGTWNRSSGPDFMDAAIKIDNKLYHGPVEIHRTSSDWFYHHHQNNAQYDKVILHVVWENDKDADEELPPCLEMKDLLTGSWQTVIEELQGEQYPYAKQVVPGACAVKWAADDDYKVSQLLDVAGLARFEEKSLSMQEQIETSGADQTIYTGIFQALGYKNNKENFQLLANGVPILKLNNTTKDIRPALLFGAAGMLPDPTTSSVLPDLLADVSLWWDSWWQVGGTSLNINWHRHCRPYNTPERRLAAGIAILEKCHYEPAKVLYNFLQTETEPQLLFKSLSDFLMINTKWSHYTSFFHQLTKPAMLLGQSRIRDIIINIILPFLHAVAIKNEDNNRADLIEQCYINSPALQDNRLLKEATHRFFVPPSRAKKLLKKAARQQGMIEIYQNFCKFLYNDCENCPLVMHLSVDE